MYFIFSIVEHTQRLDYQCMALKLRAHVCACLDVSCFEQKTILSPPAAFQYQIYIIIKYNTFPLAVHDIELFWYMRKCGMEKLKNFI